MSYIVDARPKTFVELTSDPNLVAIEKSSVGPRRIADVRRHVGRRLTLFCGVDDLVTKIHVLGPNGWISRPDNSFPAENRLLWDLLEAADFEKACRVYAWYTPLPHLDTLPKRVQYLKRAAA